MKQIERKCGLVVCRIAVTAAALALAATLAAFPVVAQATPRASFAASAASDEAAVSRDALIRLVDRTASLARVYGLGAGVGGRLSEARELLESASPDQIAQFRQIGPQVRQLQEILAQADAILASPGRSALATESTGFPDADDPNYNWNFFVPGQSADLDDAGGSSDADTDSQSRSGNCSFSSRKTTQEMFALLNGTAIAEVVAQVASRICEQVIVVLGGGNASIVCIITDVIFDVVKAVQDNIFLCEDTLDGAQAEASYLRLGHLHTDIQDAQTALSVQLESARTDINSTVVQAAADQITAVNEAAVTVTTAVNAARDQVTQAVNASTASILSSIQANQDLFLRIEIEKALHQNKHFAALYLPEANGGRLGTVRQIAQDTVAAVAASGDTVIGAHSRLALAEQEYAAGRWKKAFSLYAEAYFEAIKVLGETR
jgi:hypothetical protein